MTHSRGYFKKMSKQQLKPKKKDLTKIVERKKNRESNLEQEMVEHCIEFFNGNCEVIKTGTNGFMDRTCIYGGGRTLYYEVKRPDKSGQVSALQASMIIKMHRLDHDAGVFDNLADFKEFVSKCVGMSIYGRK